MDMAKAKTVAFLNIVSVAGSTATVSTIGTRGGLESVPGLVGNHMGRWREHDRHGCADAALQSHSYAANGSYTTTLTVHDSTGKSASASRTIPIGSWCLKAM